MSKSSTSNGPTGKPSRKPSPFADRRLIPLLVIVVGIVGYYGYQWWADGAARAAARQQVLNETRTELDKDKPDRDVLSKLMARLSRLPDAAMSAELLAAQAEIEWARGRPEKADKLFGAIAASPSATATDKSLGARILLAKHADFGGDIVQAKTMLQQAMLLAEQAYAETRDVKDLFRAWQAAIRLWDDHTKELTALLRANHPESPQCKLAELSESFEPVRDRQAVADLAVDFAVPPVELQAMQTIVTLHDGDIPGALRVAEQQLIASPGIPAVRISLAYVLHICATGHEAGSADQIVFIKRRNEQLDWLDARAPVEKRAKWEPMRQLR